MKKSIILLLLVLLIANASKAFGTMYDTEANPLNATNLWVMNNCTNMFDTSFNCANTGCDLVAGNITDVGGTIQALSCVSGNSDYIDLNWGADEWDFAKPNSMCWRIKTGALDTNRMIYSVYKDVGGGQTIEAEWRSTPIIYFKNNFDGSNANTFGYSTGATALNGATWFSFCVTHHINGSIAFWINDTRQETSSESTDSTAGSGTLDNDIQLWARNLDGAISLYETGTVAEVMTFEYEVKEGEVTTFWKQNYTASAPAADTNTSTIDILFSNYTHPDTYKSSFNVNEDFRIWGNWTDDNDNSSLNMTYGECNFTIINMSITSADEDDFTICNNGCDYDTFTSGYHWNNSVNVLADIFYVRACHTQSENDALTLNISCNDGAISATDTFEVAEIIQCDDGYSSLKISTSSCINYADINYTLANDAVGLQQSHTISKAHLHRKYYTHNESGYFNTSKKLWQLNYTLHPHSASTGLVYFNCTPYAAKDPNFNNSAAENVYGVNIPPVITFQVINYSGGRINLTDGMVIEYYSGIWNWLINIEDDNLDTHNFTWSNSSGILSSHQGREAISYEDTSDGLFAGFIAGNVYNLTVWANDTNANITTAQLLFNVTDTSFPVLTGFTNSSIEVNNVYTFNGSATDQYLWSFGISCNNSFNYSITGLAVTSFNFINNNTNITSNTLCYINASDGHTASLIGDISISNDGRKIYFNDISLTAGADLDSVTFTKYADKYSFCITPVSKDPVIVLEIPENCVKYPSDDYKGWFICDDHYWLDFEGSYPVEWDEGFRSITIDVKAAKANEVCFNSIGELNTIYQHQLITATLPAVDENLYNNTIIDNTNFFNTENMNLTTTSGVLLFMFLFLILVAMVVLAEWLRVPAIAFLVSVGIFFYSLLIYTKISAVFGVIIIALSMMYGIRSVLMAKGG